MCVLDVKYFPFDEQTCDLVFASWTRDIKSLDLVVGNNRVSRSPKDTKFFQENEEWRVLFATIERREVWLHFIHILQISGISWFSNQKEQEPIEELMLQWQILVEFKKGGIIDH